MNFSPPLSKKEYIFIQLNCYICCNLLASLGMEFGLKYLICVKITFSISGVGRGVKFNLFKRWHNWQGGWHWLSATLYAHVQNFCIIELLASLLRGFDVDLFVLRTLGNFCQQKCKQGSSYGHFMTSPFVSGFEMSSVPFIHCTSNKKVKKWQIFKKNGKPTRRTVNYKLGTWTLRIGKSDEWCQICFYDV